tara:strand:- start:450 stop:1130 length:681 start_codon:yes stop_codon:yes gene_type:complete
MRKFVFGLGTGCCGTSSLAWLLNSQDGAFVGHELFPILPWSTSSEAQRFFADNKWEQLNHESHLYDIVGDVGSYYLPYARFLMNNLSLSLLSPAKNEIDFKFIILQRDKKEVVDAFIEKFKRQKNNPLQVSKSGIQSCSAAAKIWDKSFPKYASDASLEECVGWYWEDYYAEANYLLNEYPEHFKLYNVKDLNNENKVLELLNFVGVENPKILLARKNKREDVSIF